MNLKTTFVLAGLLILGGFGWLALSFRSAGAASSPTKDFLASLPKQKSDLREIEIVATPMHPRSYVLTSEDGKTWHLPGNWPIRNAEVDDLIGTITTLATRYQPIPFDEKKAKAYGLDDKNCLKLKIKIKDKTHNLRLGEGAAMDETNEGKNTFSRPTYLRLDEQKEIVRLGPGVIGVLDRDVDFFRKRRLFKTDNLAKEEGGKDKIEQVVTDEITVASPDARFTLKKKDKEWTLENMQVKKDEKNKDGQTVSVWKNADADVDRVNPEKLAALLEGIPDFWAESFWTAERLQNELKRTGLENPEFIVTVKGPDGAPVTLEIGGPARVVSKTVMKMMNLGPQMGMRPIPQTVTEEYRFAQLKGNKEVFDVKVAKLKDVTVALDELRDPKLARFKPADVAKVEIQVGGKDLVFVKDKDKWQMEKPLKVEAESSEISTLLDKIANLEVKKEDVISKDALAKLGKEKSVGTVKLHIEEMSKKSDEEDDKDKKPEVKKKYEVIVHLSAGEKQKDKFLARVDGWPRINAIEKDVVELVEREPVAYRQRKVLDLAAADLAKVEITRGKDTFLMERKDDAWKLVKPTEAKLDAEKVNQLAGELGKLEAIKFVSESPKPEDLDKFGLKEPKVTATLTPKDEKQKPHKLQIGKQVEFKDEYYARLDDGPVWLLKKATLESADKDSLAYRAGDGWQVAADQIQEIKIGRKDGEFTLKKKDKTWQLAGPFDATGSEDAAKTVVDDLSGLKIEKFVADSVTDFAKYGLDKPFLKAEVTTGKDKEKTVSVLSIGKLDEDGKSRFGRIGENKTIFLVADKLAQTLNREPTDYVSKELIALDTPNIDKVKVKAKTGYTLVKEKDTWQVIDSPAAKFLPDASKVNNLIDAWRKLKAEQIVEFGPKIDWKKNGLEPPEATVTVELKDGDKTKTHTLSLGREVGLGRYARIDQQPALVILNPGTLDDMPLSHLDFLNRDLFKAPADNFLGFERKMPGQDLDIVLREDDWFMDQPQKRPADNLLLKPIVEKLQNLVAKRVAAYPAGDLKEYGLDTPVAVVIVKENDGKKHYIKLGKTVDAKSQDRYARVDDGPMIVVLAGDLANHLVQPALYFADRNLATFGGADRVDYEKGTRKLVFVKTSGRWMLVDPVKSDADETLTKTVENLGRLRVDEIVADKGDVKDYGLDKPAAQWHVFIGDKEKLHVLVGAVEKDKKTDRPRRYGKLASSEQIFLIGADMVERLLEEYRARKPWTSLDAAQVSKITVKSPSSSFVLEKVDDKWKVAGNPKAKVAAGAVTETLDALAGLKATQFVVDTKGDLKLYGLNPPEYVVEVDVPGGKRVLSVGRPEGDTKKRYAAAEGVEGVFILAEPDAVKLTRGPDAYLEDGKQ